MNGSDDDQFLASDAQLVLLKFLDGMVHATDVQNLNLRDFIPIAKELVKVSVPRLFNEPHAFSDAQVQCLTSSIRLLLDVFQTGLTNSGGPDYPPSNDNSILAESLIGSIPEIIY